MTLVEQWLGWLTHERGRSPNTVATYARTLRTLRHDLENATREEIEEWWRSRAGYAPTTRANELSAVREFFRWCQRFEHRNDDPTARLDPPRLPRNVHRYVGREDLAHLLRELPTDLGRAVALGAYAGMRIAEVAVLDWSDVDREMSRIIIRGKGAKERHVGLAPLLLDRLLPDTGGNVVTAGQRPYTVTALRVRVNRAIRDAGVDGTFHKLRHRYGTMAVAAGIPLTSVARAMGHASPTTTALYVGASDSDLDLIAEAVTR